MTEKENTVFRTITVSRAIQEKYPANIIRNQKYSWYSFPFIVLFNQFRHFFNIYFFLISLSQIFNSYRIGPPITSIAPWVFVLFLTLGKEAIDDFKRYVRDKEANSEKYKKIMRDGIHIVPSSTLCVGDLVILEKNQRVPADMVVLKTQEIEGQCFIRTDQLDGETDWKLRNAVSSVNSQDYSDLFKKTKEMRTASEKCADSFVDLHDSVEEVSPQEVKVSPQEVKVSPQEVSPVKASPVKIVAENLEKLKLDSAQNEDFENEFSSESIGMENMHTLHSYSTPSIESENEDKSEIICNYKSPQQSDDNFSQRSNSEHEGGKLLEQASFQEFKDFAEDVSVKDKDEEKSEEKSEEINDGKKKEDKDFKEINDKKSDKKNDKEIDKESDKESESQESHEEKHTGGEHSQESSQHQTAIAINQNIPEATSATILQMKADTTKIFSQDITIYADKPHKDIYNFIGRITSDKNGEVISEPLNLENVIWMNTVLATQSVIGAVIYTGCETRAMQNTAKPRNKFGKIEEEINYYSILLCGSSIIAGIVFLFFSGISNRFDITLIRFIIIFSSVIPISLKVTIDVARLFFYSNWVMKDTDIPGCIVRNSNIPEELGRITYLLTDKTGTLTRNEMEMRKVHVGTICYTTELNDEVTRLLAKKMKTRGHKTRDLGTKVYDMVRALALCHNVTPVVEDGVRSYQASSPDEVALVQWCENVGVVLERRTKDQIVIGILGEMLKTYKILYIFPFTSDTKRMGVIMRDLETKEVFFFLKGADMIMKKIVEKNDWLDEEVDNMAREGLRTLVIGMKRLNGEEFAEFEKNYKKANLAIHDRAVQIQAVVCQLERNLKLLGLTGVEDKLQENVNQSLENLRNAGVKIWMLTGDKIETAISISISSRLFLKRNLYEILTVSSREDAWEKLTNLKAKMINYVIIDGHSLQVMIDSFMKEFILFAATLDAVVCCRCTPTQKALVARNLRMLTSHRVACIGDGGNDVSMITEANVGIGIVGKEGNQASLAADFSILKFSDITTLFFWHGRNCYRGTAKLIQFIIHRGTIISVMQGIFSAIFGFAPIALYQGLIMVGYVCIYTFCPMWCIILDRDVSKVNVFRYPELYKEMVQNKILSAKSFAAWNLISFYQGSVIMILTFYQFSHELLSLVTITFSCLVLNELLVVLLMVSTINKWMMLSQIISLVAYILSFFILKDELKLPTSLFSFILKLVLISAIAIFFSIIEVLYLKIIRPPAYSKIANATI